MAKNIHIYVHDRKKVKDSGRLVQTIEDGNAVVKVYYDSGNMEYQCRLFVGGKDQGEGPTYYTDDKADAISTAKDMVKRAKTKDAGSELDKFVANVKEANSMLTKASSLVSQMSSFEDQGLKKQASELERLIDAARAYAFKIR